MDSLSASEILLFGDFRLDRAGGGLFRLQPGRPPVAVTLGSRALDLLCLLAGRPGELVTHAEIMATVWARTVVAPANLPVQIAAIRRALDCRGAAPSMIQTVPGQGYRFVCRVRVAPVDAGPPASLIPVSPLRPAAWPVGREPELRMLAELFRRSAAGQRNVAFITGEAGIGKTTLLAMALERIPQDYLVLRGGCTEFLGAGEAFMPLIEALQSACGESGGALLVQALRENAPTWLAQMPALLPPQDRGALHAEMFGASRERMLREFCDFVEAIGRSRPCLLIVEDCHWSDVATLDALSHLARRDRPVPILALATHRPAGGPGDGPPVLRLQQDLYVKGRCTGIALDRLSAADVARYLDARFANPALTRALFEPVFARTGGHALFVVSLLDDLVACGALRQREAGWTLRAEPVDFERVPLDAWHMITRQIASLDRTDLAVLEMASVAGLDFTAAGIALAAGEDVVAVEHRCETLAGQAHALQRAGHADWPDGTRSGRYAFRHALYREVLYRRLAPGRKARVHLGIAEALEQGHAGRLDDIAVALAYHFEQGRDMARAVRYLALAAANASRRFANREAAQYLGQALGLAVHLPDGAVAVRMGLMRQRGWALRSAGDLTGSLRDLQAIVALAAQTGQVQLEAMALMDFSRFSLFADRRHCIAAAERAAALCPAIEDEAAAALVRGSAASIRLLLQPCRTEDLALCRAAIRLTADARDPATVMRRCGIEGTLGTVTGDYRMSRRATSQAKALAREGGDLFMFVLNNSMEVFALVHLGGLGEAKRRTQEALALAERNGNRIATLLGRLTLAYLHVAAHDFAGAVALAVRDWPPDAETGPFLAAFHRAVSIRAHVGLGDDRAARRLVAELADCSDAEIDTIDYGVRVETCRYVADYLIESGDLDGAARWAERLGMIAARAPDTNYVIQARYLAARIALALGLAGEARDLLDGAVRLLDGAGLPVTAWQVFAFSATAFEQAGRMVQAADHRARAARLVHAMASELDSDDTVRTVLLGVVRCEEAVRCERRPG